MTNLKKIKNYNVHKMREMMISLTHKRELCKMTNCEHKDKEVCGGLYCMELVEGWLNSEREEKDDINL